MSDERGIKESFNCILSFIVPRSAFIVYFLCACVANLSIPVWRELR